MPRYLFSVLRNILQSKVSYSTSTSRKLKKPNSLISKLTSTFDTSCIDEALRHKELQNINFDEWKSRIYVLKNYNFSDAECFKMISLHPDLLKIPVENFENNVKQWFLADFGLENFKLLLQSQPHLIEIDVKDIRKRLPHLRIYFRKSEGLCNLLTVSPNIMSDNWKGLIEKINYIVKVRKFNMGDIIKSQALSKSLYFIQFRLELIEKCGIYRKDDTPVHKKNMYDKTKYKNPSLSQILDPNITEFVKVAQISEEEYLFCESLYKEQNEEDLEEEEKLEDSYK